ncbi:hypothetical protein [Micromonospora sp. NPDC005367]|uniref:hypothetical protein n=1 Tax=Micromonospora sp. NPDC005367 TaxID=3155590 RepID=UPI00339DC0B7
MPEQPSIDTFQRLVDNIRGELVAISVPLNLPVLAAGSGTDRARPWVRLSL